VVRALCKVPCLGAGDSGDGAATAEGDEDALAMAVNVTLALPAEAAFRAASQVQRRRVVVATDNHQVTMLHLTTVG